MFCPFPPSVDVTLDIDDSDTVGQPLDYMSYFVDNHLIDLSDNKIDTTDFFRQYMAGFLISTRETALSVCRSYDTDSINTKICQMILATEIVQDNPVFTESLPRQVYENASNCTKDAINMRVGLGILSYQAAVGCSLEDSVSRSDTNDLPFCANYTFVIDNDTFSFMSDNGTRDVSQIVANFSVDGAVRDELEEGLNHTGRVYYAPTSTQITGATVYYNNQVRYY